MLGAEKSAGAELGSADVVPNVEQAIPESRQEETMLPAKGTKIY